MSTEESEGRTQTNDMGGHEDEVEDAMEQQHVAVGRGTIGESCHWQEMDLRDGHGTRCVLIRNGMSWKVLRRMLIGSRFHHQQNTPRQGQPFTWRRRPDLGLHPLVFVGRRVFSRDSIIGQVAIGAISKPRRLIFA
jgi:hypothetical protein